MKFAGERPYANPETAARKLLMIARAVEPVQDGRIHIELINAALLYQHGASPDEYGAGLARAVDLGWLELHESGTFVRLADTGKNVFDAAADGK